MVDLNDDGVPGTGRTFEACEESSVTPLLEPLRERLHSQRPYWVAAMQVMGTVCALTLSILDAGYFLEWDQSKGPPCRSGSTQHQPRVRKSRLRLGSSGGGRDPWHYGAVCGY